MNIREKWLAIGQIPAVRTALFVFGLVPEEVNAKVNDAWKKYIGSKR